MHNETTPPPTTTGPLTPEPRDPRVALAVELARAGRSDEEIEAALNEYDAAEVSQ